MLMMDSLDVQEDSSSELRKLLIANIWAAAWDFQQFDILTGVD